MSTISLERGGDVRVGHFHEGVMVSLSKAAGAGMARLLTPEEAERLIELLTLNVREWRA
jgi:hypothetical protein